MTTTLAADRRRQVAVQTGEGTVEIIYGSTSVPAGPRTLGGYLARSALVGEWPTVLVFGPEPTPTSAVKNMCRVLARHGIAALAPDLTESHDANESISHSVANFLADPAGEWSNAQFGYGVIGFGVGIYDATRLAELDGRVLGGAVIGATIDEFAANALAAAAVPVIAILSREDESTDVDLSVSARDRAPQTTFVVYSNGEEGFWDETSDGFDEDLQTDVVERLVDFFTDQLPPRV
jgi:dienelactone hydrolase